MQIVLITVLPINCPHGMGAYSVPFTNQIVFISSGLLVFSEMPTCIIVAPNVSYMLASLVCMFLTFSIS